MVSQVRQALGSNARVLVFGNTFDALDRWRLGALGIPDVHPYTLQDTDLSELIAKSASKERHSCMPGARPSVIFRPVEVPTPTIQIPIEMFLLVIASGWSESKLFENARNLVCDAARAAGHGPEALKTLQQACVSPIELVDVDASEISMPIRAYTYAFATWLALTDDVISPQEESTLHVLAFVLGLPIRDRTAIQSAVEQVRERDANPTRSNFRFNDFSRSVAPIFERMIHGPRHSPIPGVRIPQRS
jgi:hypothetical protein